MLGCLILLAASLVEGPQGYNCWPMIQSVRGKLVCVYTTGLRHDPGERGRGTYARTSSDGGRTWSARVTVAQDPKRGQTPVAKGLDENGDMLVWVRRYGGGPLMALYRTKDGSSFDLVAEPTLDRGPMMQITDVFRVPKVGLMSFWFGGSYADDDRPRRWGTMTSRDNGRTWEQRVCGENMRRRDWPTEPSGFALDDGRIFCVARTEGTSGQMQLTSLDGGRTWDVRHTNIFDVMSSTPSLLYDAKTGLVSNYYYQRGAGRLKRRVVRLADVFDHPEAWPEPETLVDDGGQAHHAGNANATFLDGRPFVTWYTGDERNCSVMVLEAPAATPWIGDGEPTREGAAFYADDPAPEFTASFVLPEGASSADITIACAGYYALALNGRPAGVSETSLMPLWSPFDHTVYADTFKARVEGWKDGKVEGCALHPFPATNVVTVTLGNGFYNLPPLLFWGKLCFREEQAHGRPCFRLTVGGVDAPLVWTWRRTNIRKNCVYLGTEIDATQPQDAAARPAAVVTGPRGKVVPRRAPPVVYRDRAVGKVIRQTGMTYVVDFGANLSGVPTFVFSGQERGDRIEIVYGERLDKEGRVNPLTQTAGQIKRPGKGGPGAPDVAAQRDAYVCAGTGDERFTPPFTWHICRYAEVRGARKPPCAELRTVMSDLVRVAPGKGFRSPSDELMKLHEVCVRTFCDNLIGVQSDCPGRERLGYGGDIVASCEAMCLNFDMREFYLKTLQDFADEAADDGWITETAPFVGIADRSGLEAGARRAGPVSWTVAVPVLMDTLMRHYPDLRDRVLAYYPTCARYVRLMDARFPSGIVPNCIGDHEALERAPNDVTATAHWHEFVRLTAGFARQLGRNDEADAFAAIAAKVKAAFRTKYVKDGVVANGTQSAQAQALYFGLVPADQVKAAERRLVAAVEEKGCAPHTGIFSTRYMLEYLSTHSYRELASKLVLHRGFPGWLHMLDNGATTLWETWKESDNVYSNCHPMFGSVDEWILKYGNVPEGGR